VALGNGQDQGGGHRDEEVLVAFKGGCHRLSGRETGKEKVKISTTFDLVCAYSD